MLELNLLIFYKHTQPSCMMIKKIKFWKEAEKFAYIYRQVHKAKTPIV